MKKVPVAVSSRDGYGFPLTVATTGRFRSDSVPVLAEDGSLLGEIVRQGQDLVAYWDLQVRRLGSRVASVETRRLLAASGRLSASVDEDGWIYAFRVREPSHVSTRVKPARSAPAPNEVETCWSSGGRILSVR